MSKDRLRKSTVDTDMHDLLCTQTKYELFIFSLIV